MTDTTVQHDNHLRPWLAARFGVKVGQSLFGVREARFHVTAGDLDYDSNCGIGPTVFHAALEYAAQYDGIMFNRLVDIELGALTMQDCKLISERMHLRSYRVRAYVSLKTGRVLKIRAGCRTWKSIAEAVAHYAGGGRYKSRYLKWRKINDKANALPEDFENAGIFGESVRRAADIPECQRNDALLAIARLSARVLQYQKRCSL